MKTDSSVLEKDLDNELREAAKKLILEKNDVGNGFKEIVANAALKSRKELFELTLEYIVLKDKYKPLFHEEPELLKEAYGGL